MKRAFPVFLAFLAMGFADAAGPFVSLAREQFQLSYFAAQWITFSGFIMFGLLSIPMGLVQDRTGKKTILLAGLAIMLAGLLIPAIAGFTTFPVFLITVLLLGAGEPALRVGDEVIVLRAGDVDVLVANAALPASGRLEEYTPEQIDRALDVNLRGPILLVHALTPGMVARGRGHARHRQRHDCTVTRIERSPSKSRTRQLAHRRCRHGTS